MMRRTQLCPMILAFAILAGSCGRDTQFIHHAVESPPKIFSSTHKLKELEGDRQVDILFVIDNSGSMDSHQQALIRNADTFINSFVTNGGMNWKIGLISTDVRDNPFIGLDPTNELTSKTPGNIQLFKDAVNQLGTYGDATERTFAPVMKWLPKYPIFLRPSAMLALIMITDAEEQSTETAADFIQFLTSTKGRLDRVVTYGVFAANDLGCNVCDSWWNYANSPYEQVIKATNGKTYPLCKDFGQNLADLSKDLVSRVVRPSIQLSSRPRLSTLRMNHRGRAVKGGPETESGYWMYDFDGNAIRFHNLDFAPGDNEEVQIVYEIAE